MIGKVATIGFFDGVHVGHQCLIKQVQDVASVKEMHTLVITFDNHPRQVVQPDFVPALLTSNEEKLNFLKETGVDEVISLHFDKSLSMLSAKDFMRKMHDEMGVMVLVMGYDHRFGHDGGTFEEYQKWGFETGVEVLLAKELKGMKVSSSEARRALLKGNLEYATEILGRNYTLSGTVVQGHHVGREIGFPTANISIQEDKLLPANGVYAVWVTLSSGDKYRGMLNIGRRPTLDNGKDVSVEVHILDFSGDLYNQNVSLEMIKQLRQECRFDSREALMAQLSLDEQSVRTLL